MGYKEGEDAGHAAGFAEGEDYGYFEGSQKGPDPFPLIPTATISHSIQTTTTSVNSSSQTHDSMALEKPAHITKSTKSLKSTMQSLPHHLQHPQHLKLFPTIQFCYQCHPTLANHQNRPKLLKTVCSHHQSHGTYPKHPRMLKIVRPQYQSFPTLLYH